YPRRRDHRARDDRERGGGGALAVTLVWSSGDRLRLAGRIAVAVSLDQGVYRKADGGVPDSSVAVDDAHSRVVARLGVGGHCRAGRVRAGALRWFVFRECRQT